MVFDGDEGRLSEEAFLRDFAGDLPAAKAKVLYAVQEPFQKVLLSGKTTQAAWRSKPSYYAVSTEDRTINPDLQRFMAKRMGAKTIEVKASHLSLSDLPSRGDHAADPRSCRAANLANPQMGLYCLKFWRASTLCQIACKLATSHAPKGRLNASRSNEAARVHRHPGKCGSGMAAGLLRPVA